MKKIIIVLCVAVVLFAVGYNAYQSQKQATTGKQKVYAILPITGVLSFQGKEEKKTMEIWMQNHPNAPFDLEILDNESNATKSLTLAQRVAMSDKRPLFICPTGAMCHPVLPQLKTMNGFMILSPSTQNEDNTYKEFQRISHGSIDLIKPLITHAKKDQTVVILHSNDMAGYTCANKIEEEMAKKDVKVIKKMSFDTKELDTRMLVLKAISYKTDAIFVTAAPSIGFINIVKELKLQEYPGIIWADSVSAPSITEQLGNKAEGIYSSAIPTTQIYQKYPQIVKTFQDNKLPLYIITIDTWDTMDVINYFISNNIPFTQEAFLKMGKWHGISSDITFMPNGNSAYDFVLSVIQDGKIVPVEEGE